MLPLTICSPSTCSTLRLSIARTPPCTTAPAKHGPPTSLFPSLHLSLATLAALIAWRARPLFGWCAAPMVVAVAMSITTMKQHFVVDGAGAVALATLAFRTRIASFDEHQHGYSKATRNRGPWWMPYYETYPSRAEAQSREYARKRKKSAAAIRALFSAPEPSNDSNPASPR